MGPIGIALLSLYFIVVPVWTVGALLALWPSVAATSQSAPRVGADSVGTSPPAVADSSSLRASVGLRPEQVSLPLGVRIDFRDRPELRLLFIALLAAVLGSFIQACSSFVTFLGNRQLCRSWGIWYLFRPLIGMALGAVFYFAIRGGLLPMQADASNISPFGVAAGAGLVGMFAKEATDKLKEAFQVLFAPKGDEKRKDSLPEAASQRPTGPEAKGASDPAPRRDP
jgi:hypothetical protein